MNTLPALGKNEYEFIRRMLHFDHKKPGPYKSSNPLITEDYGWVNGDLLFTGPKDKFTKDSKLLPGNKESDIRKALSRKLIQISATGTKGVGKYGRFQKYFYRLNRDFQTYKIITYYFRDYPEFRKSAYYSLSDVLLPDPTNIYFYHYVQLLVYSYIGLLFPDKYISIEFKSKIIKFNQSSIIGNTRVCYITENTASNKELREKIMTSVEQRKKPFFTKEEFGLSLGIEVSQLSNEEIINHSKDILTIYTVIRGIIDSLIEDTKESPIFAAPLFRLFDSLIREAPAYFKLFIEDPFEFMTVIIKLQSLIALYVDDPQKQFDVLCHLLMFNKKTITLLNIVVTNDTKNIQKGKCGNKKAISKEAEHKIVDELMGYVAFYTRDYLHPQSKKNS